MLSDAPAQNSALVPFQFEGSELRAVQIEGRWWYIAVDVCRGLEVGDTSRAVARLDDDMKGTTTVRTPGGDQSLLVLSEGGMFELITTSRKSKVEGTGPWRFRRWIFNDVVPTIQKTGSYGAAPAEVPDLTDPAVLQRLILIQCTKRIEAENRAKIAEATVEVTQPKADCYDRIANSEGLFNITQAAKLLGQSPNKFMQYLRAGYLYQRGSKPVPRQEYIDRGILTLKVDMVNDKARFQSLLTPKGLGYFAKKLGVELQRELFPKTAVTA